jgi:hypothetical protein
VTEEIMGGIGAVLEEELNLISDAADSARAVILVEGESDRRALDILAKRLGWDIESDDVVIVASAGATNIARFLDLIPADVALSGLYDEAEEGILRGALDAAGKGGQGDALEALGFFMCRRDLEDELIRASGIEGVLEVIEREGDLLSWQRFSNQPAQRNRPTEMRLHRFLGTRSGRKIEYAGFLAERIDPWADDSPLVRVLAHSRNGVRAAG